MNSHPQECVPSSRVALSGLAEFLSAFPVARRGATLQAAVAFEPESTLDRALAVGPVRAAFADCWEGRFGGAVPVRELRSVLAPPVPIKTVLEFARFNIISDPREVEQALFRLLSFLASEIRPTLAESQRPLFCCIEDEYPGCPPQPAQSKLVAGDMVSSLDELTSAGRKYPTIYADPPWAYDNIALRAAAAAGFRSSLRAAQSAIAAPA